MDNPCQDYLCHGDDMRKGALNATAFEGLNRLIGSIDYL